MDKTGMWWEQQKPQTVFDMCAHRYWRLIRLPMLSRLCLWAGRWSFSPSWSLCLGLVQLQHPGLKALLFLLTLHSLYVGVGLFYLFLLTWMWFYHCDAMLVQYILWPGVCLCVFMYLCHMSVFCQNGYMDWAHFLHKVQDVSYTVLRPPSRHH